MRKNVLFLTLMLAGLLPLTARAAEDPDKLSSYDQSLLDCTKGFFSTPLNKNDLAAGKEPDAKQFEWSDQKQSALDACMKQRGFQVDYGKPVQPGEDTPPTAQSAKIDMPFYQKALQSLGIAPTPADTTKFPTTINTPTAPIIPAPAAPQQPTIIAPVPVVRAPSSPIFVPQDTGQDKKGSGGGFFVPQKTE